MDLLLNVAAHEIHVGQDDVRVPVPGLDLGREGLDEVVIRVYGLEGCEGRPP